MVQQLKSYLERTQNLIFGTLEQTLYPILIVQEWTNEKNCDPEMDKNLKMEPRANEEFEKRDLERSGSSKNGT